MDNEFWESEEVEVPQDQQEPEEDFQIPGIDTADLEEFRTESENEDIADTELLSNARLRLEQGRLYEMLLKHDLFGGVEADQRAISNVQKEIRTFIKERLEILLGLRQDPKLQPSQPENVTPQPSQFTDLEAELLKRFLAKMSGGATEKVQQADSRPAISPVSQSKPQSNGLRPMTAARKLPVATKAQQPLKTKEPTSQINVGNANIKKILEEQFGENEMPLGRPAASMRRSELIERNKRIAQRQEARKASGASANRLPAPNADQEIAIMTQHAMARNESLQQSGVSPLTLAIGKTLANKAGQSE
jgi:hypothetical protein